MTTQGRITPETLGAFLEGLPDLLESLRAEGYGLGARQHVAAHELIGSLFAHGSLPPTLLELDEWLAPLICNTPAQQEGFRERYLQWLVGRRLVDEGDLPPPPPPVTPPAPTTVTPAPTFWERIARWVSKHRLPLAAAALVAAAIFVVYQFGATYPGEKDSTKAPPKVVAPDPPVPSPTPVPPPSDAAVTVFGASTRAYVMLVALGLGLIFAALWLWYFLRRRRRRRDAERWRAKRPRYDKIKVPGARARVFRCAALRPVARGLRHYLSVESRQLDARSTVLASVGRGGLFTAVYGRRRTLPEYLVLIDRVGFGDQLAQFHSDIVARLSELDVYLDTYYFHGDPRRCREGGPDSPQFSLSDLAARHPDHYLLIFSDGTGLLSTTTGGPLPLVEQLLYWRGRALLTPVPRLEWEYREWALEREGLKVLPASLDGLRLLAEAVNTGPRSAREPDFDESPPYPDLLRQQPALWKERDEPPPNQARRLVTHLRRFLGPAGFELLCACAVYPVMQWGVTLFFAYELLGRDKVDEVLPRLLRLPWFRHGTMPPWLRRTLVSELPRARRRLVRERLEHLLLVFLEEPERGLAPRSTGELAAHDDALASLPARLGERLAAWRRSRRLRDRLEHVTARSPLTEPVFFNFITDNRPRPATFSFVSSRRATFTFIFFGAYVFLYLLMWLSGGATGAVLTAYGAMVNYLIDQEGQWWLFVTPIFLHEHLPGLGPLHLLSSMFWLYMFGPYVEKLYGSARFCVFWILTGIAGVVASYLAVRPEWAHGALGQFLFKAYDSPSTGVAGTFFGLMGVLFVFAIKHRDELPARLKRTLWIRLLPIFFIHFFIGYMWPFLTDNAMHLSGLVVGMGLALAVGYKRPGARGPVEYAWHAAQVACLLLVAVSFVMVARNLDSPPPRLSDLRERAAGTSPVIPYIEAVNSGQNALSKLMSGDTGALDRAAEMLEKTPALSPEADALREELKALVARARDTASDQSLKPAEREERLRQFDTELRGWQERFAQWTEAEGDQFGISIQPPEAPAGEKR